MKPLSRHGMAFNKEEDNRIESLRKEGFTVAQIARRMERTPLSIAGRIRYVDLNFGPIDVSTPRKAAKSEGRKYYFTGKLCPRGHLADRFVSTMACVVCVKQKKIGRDPDKRRASALRNSWRRRNMPTPTRPKPERCELCNGPQTKHALNLDHDKVTGAFRGWLCHFCNTGLGHFGDSADGLVAAIEYLDGKIYAPPDDNGKRRWGKCSASPESQCVIGRR